LSTALLEEVQNQVVVAVDGRDQHRRGAVAPRRLVDVGAPVHERPHRVGLALAGGEVQGGETAVLADQLVVFERASDAGHFRGAFGRGRRRRRGPLAAAGGAARPIFLAQRLLQRVLGRHHVGQVHHRRGDRRVGAFGEQRLHRGGAAGGRREHQRRLPVRGLRRVGLGAGVEQRGDDLGVARGRGQHERRGAGGGGRFDRRTALQQRRHHRRAPVLGGQVQRGEAADPGRGPRVGAGDQQHLGDFGLALQRRPVQGGHAVALRGIGIGAALEQLAHGSGVAGHRGVGHRAARLGLEQRRGPRRRGDDTHHPTESGPPHDAMPFPRSSRRRR
jgi:hypothetical protein